MPGFVVLFFGALMLGVASQAIKVDAKSTSEAKVDQARVSNYAALYRTFVRHVAEYMSANPGIPAGTYTWSHVTDVAVVSGAQSINLPATIRSVVMPSGWRFIADGAGDYVICTPVKDEEIAGEIAKILKNRTEKMVRTNGDYFVVGDPSNTSAITAEANKCAN